jgi:hypothetical protein
VLPERAAEVRAWLEEVVGTWYMPPFVAAPALEWRIREARWDRSGCCADVRLTVLYSQSDASAEAFVRTEVVPVLMSTVSLLRAAAMRGEAKQNRHPYVDVYYIDATAPKRTLPPEPGQPVMPVNINGGVTMLRTGRIVVYRREDACKVLVHELLHLHGLDQALRNAHRAEARLRARYGVVAVDRGVPLGINEAFTETLACYLHTIWWSLARKRSPESTLRRVSTHVRSVADRTTAHYGGTLAYVEGTHCFAYVACRAALWHGPFLKRVLAAYPPGKPPTDAEAFVDLLIEALDRRRRRQKGSGSSAPGASLQMTPLQ